VFNIYLSTGKAHCISHPSTPEMKLNVHNKIPFSMKYAATRSNNMPAHVPVEGWGKFIPVPSCVKKLSVIKHVNI
jgi:hypothetical protein